MQGDRFLVAVCLWMLALLGLARVPWIEAELLVPFAGLQGHAACTLVGADPTTIRVDSSCTGADAIALCLAAILAFPVPWRRRLAAAAAGLALILVLNTARIATLAIAVDRPRLFSLLHVYAWPALLVIVIAAYVFLWMRSTADRRGPALPAGAVAFVAATVFLTALYFATLDRVLASAPLAAAARATAASGAAAMTALGATATATGCTVRTADGAFLVTPECIWTPVLPLYVAAVAVFAAPRRRRVVLLALTLPVFFALGIARLLVLALPAAIIGSPLTAIHGFYQFVAAIVAIALAATLSQRRAAVALVTGAAVFVAARLVDGVPFAVAAAIRAGADNAPRYPDPQGALAILPAFQLAVFVALFVALRRPGWRRLIAGLGAVTVSQVALITGLDELARSLAVTPHVILIRAWALAAPIALAVALGYTGRPGRRGASSSLAIEDHGEPAAATIDTGPTGVVSPGSSAR